MSKRDIIILVVGVVLLGAPAVISLFMYIYTGHAPFGGNQVMVSTITAFSFAVMWGLARSE